MIQTIQTPVPNIFSIAQHQRPMSFSHSTTDSEKRLIKKISNAEIKLRLLKWHLLDSFALVHLNETETITLCLSTQAEKTQLKQSSG